MRNLWFLSLFLLSCGSSGNETSRRGATNGPLEIPVHEVRLEQLESPLRAEGFLQPLRSVSLFSLEGGMVKEVYKEVGDFAVEGQGVASLENPAFVLESKNLELELHEAKTRTAILTAELGEAEARTRLEKKNFDRLSRNYGNSSVSASQLDQAELEWKKAQASLGALQSEHDHLEIRTGLLDTLHQLLISRLDRLELRAPFSGFVNACFVSPGALLPPATSDSLSIPLFELVDLSRLLLRVEFPLSVQLHLQKGLPMQITLPNGRTADAFVEHLGLKADPRRQTVSADLYIDNPDSSLRPGIRAVAETKKPFRWEAPALPVEAVRSLNQDPYVWLVEDGLLRRYPLTPGLKANGMIDVSQSRIGPGSQVALGPADNFEDGMPIRIRQVGH